MDIFDEIARLKKDRNACVLAHYYQEPDIQDIADHIGDSLQLAQVAAKTDADIILFAGVHFMAETAKILNPGKIVLLPDLSAGCSLADACPVEDFRAFKKDHPHHLVITYLNCSAEVKAESDIICTSSNAVGIVNALPLDKKIIFAPDKNLGAYVMKKTGRDMLLWNGTCMVHEIFSEKKLIQLKVRHPSAAVLAHPECEQPILDMADFIGSTTAILNYAKTDPGDAYIIATEAGIIHQMKKQVPEKTFIPAPTNNQCACNECPHMRKNTLEKVRLALENLNPRIEINEEIRQRALVPIRRMLEFSSSGLVL